MNLLPATNEVAHFRSMIARRLGLHFDESKFGQLAKLLHQRAQATHQTCERYLGQLDGAYHGADELYRLAIDLTVTETYFLRNTDQFRACTEVALPARLASKGTGEPVRLLSAGCASGEEPYSLAIVARENFAHALSQIAISACDVNASMLDRAARARYTNWSLRDFPADLKARWFQADGDAFKLDPTVRAMVTFEQRNLAEAAEDFWRPDSLDIIFCRNVLMYFSPEQAQHVIARMARALHPGGYLFLGHAETLRGLSNDFLLCHTHGTFYYQRREGHATAPPVEQPWSVQPHLPLKTSNVLTDTRWMDEIARASERIQALSLPVTDGCGHSAKAAPATATAAANTSQPAPDKPVALDPDLLLLQAVSLCHSGALDAARAASRALLQQDALNAGAYYVLALCCEGAADLAGAMEHNQTAVYLDPGFAMPRLHLGLLARRLGDTEAALQELGLALQLLQQEDASRLLLFADGFRREALVALCRAELSSLGAPP